MLAFATADDLAALLNRTFTSAEEAWVGTLLDAASSYLRGLADGQILYPQQTVTYTGYPSAGREDLPQWPVVSVGSVTRDGAPVEYKYRPGFIMVSGDEPVDITFTFGHVTAPTELNRLACVLVSAALIPLEAELGLTAGGLSSVALDDFKVAFADAGAQSGMTLPKIQADAVRKQFGRGGIDTVEARW
ncbi:hypothetical protein [uncultured Microbacterium sp.]|uniref:hypothetical protein n=1 Tax=uncultured Microbacterium sp. TaxID=191216 RepID=UPI002626189B|nr:hypothetical protein [uncultured Microbacterium sp.]